MFLSIIKFSQLLPSFLPISRSQRYKWHTRYDSRGHTTWISFPGNQPQTFTMKPSTSSSSSVLSSFLVLLAFIPFSSSYLLPPSIIGSTVEHQNHTAISSFRVVNRRNLIQCPDPNPFLQINVSSENSPLSDDEYVNVTVSGVFHPSDGDWVAMISPSDSK